MLFLLVKKTVFVIFSSNKTSVITYYINAEHFLHTKAFPALFSLPLSSHCFPFISVHYKTKYRDLRPA